MENTVCIEEGNLGEYLKLIFNKDFIHNRHFITKNRPDYRNDELKLIVEFDGPQHYTSPSRIIEDYRRDDFYLNNGYKTVRIPMFIQLSTSSIKELFDVDMNFKQIYQHGFISDKKTLTLPSQFCELGIIRFKNDLEKFSAEKEEIINSLINKIQKIGDINLVLPPSLHYLDECK